MRRARIGAPGQRFHGDYPRLDDPARISRSPSNNSVNYSTLQSPAPRSVSADPAYICKGFPDSR